MVENNTSNQLQTVLTEEARQTLLELQTEIQQQEQLNRSEISDYIKIMAGDRKKLRFEPARTRKEMVTFKEGEEPVLQYKFYASELIDEQKELWTRVREWTISPRWAKLVIPLLLRGFLTLEITRIGSDKNTNYTVVPT
ncbi:MAG: hypothetical protein WA941_12615 [Nitrososphaeraceae archaeon]